MRKLSELLPIARKYLVTVEDVRDDAETYACFAARDAHKAGEMTVVEYAELRDAIEAEIVRQTGGLRITILGVADHCYDRRFESRCCPEYIAFRDAWLDNLQGKLELESV